MFDGLTGTSTTRDRETGYLAPPRQARRSALRRVMP